MFEIFQRSLPKGIKGKSVVIRDGEVRVCGESRYVPKITLDSGAISASYVGAGLLERLGDAVTRYPCKHQARLADGQTRVEITEMVRLQVQVSGVDEKLTEPIYTEFYVLPQLGEEMIVGLPDLLGSYWPVFIDILTEARSRGSPEHRQAGGERLEELVSIVERELLKPRGPEPCVLKSAANEGRAILKRYQAIKRRVTQDPQLKTIITSSSRGARELLMSPRHGVVYRDDRVENLVANLEFAAEHPALAAGMLLDPWSKEPEICPEEIDTPDPLSFGEDILHYLEVGVDEARKEYLELLNTRVSEEFRREVPEIMELLQSELALDTFVPTEWRGLKVDPVQFVIKGDLPTKLVASVRPIRQELYAAAKKEFDRLDTYFYESDPAKCTSPHASPLVIAAKATYPFIRFCGDYRRVNEFITVPQTPIPIVQHELVKASKFRVFIDLDMTNSFHQLPLSEEASQLLSVKTPWGLVRPKFLPEGVGPASGLLQSTVRKVFEDFEGWAVVIFDNFLICANDYRDAYEKLQKVLLRAKEFGLVLKLKKSWFGVPQVDFFGYQVRHGSWDLSPDRKAAISDIPMPTNAKQMQSFLGAALFFHQHVSDYSEWAAKLYEMTHQQFSWDPASWQYDYRGHFDKFKVAIQQATTLYFPDYSLPWVLRVDASEHAVGAVLYQEFVTSNDEIVHRPIMFTSKRFSEPAQRWDAYKREAYAIYHGVNSAHWYLRGKEFLLETDHRNLVWIETSQSPIVVRWRSLLQSYDFKIRHIPGRENRVADWLSRPPLFTATEASLSLLDEPIPSFDEIMQRVHGGRAMHMGAAETWRRAREMFPTANISQQAVREYVRQCPLCQKTRDTGVRGLPAQTLSLKPLTYRRTIGVDHLTVTPMDSNGNTCVILLVEHYSHFPQAYPAKDYTAVTVAKALFKHFCTFGMFDQIASDPGSAFMSEVVQLLLQWLGLAHKVSLIQRHESNGCEGSNKQFLRHLTTLVMDERLKERWSDDTVLPVINFFLASFPTSETGGFTPFQLKYGTQDATYYRLPEELAPDQRSSQFLKLLNADLQVIRESSTALQQQIAEERRGSEGTLPHYVPGDLVLWNSRENPCAFLPEKLTAAYLGPLEVISHEKNDVKCRHVVLQTEHVLHVSRLKPFFGTLDDARRVAIHDKDQHHIVTIQWYAGNPHKRSSLSFGILWDDGFQERPYDAELAETEQFQQFVRARPELFPLRFSTVEAQREIRSMRRQQITAIESNSFLSLRYYDGVTTAWYDSLGLPDRDKLYVVPVVFDRWLNARKQVAVVQIPLLGISARLDTYDVFAHIHSVLDPISHVEVTADLRERFPRVWEG